MSSQDNAERIVASFGPRRINYKDLRVVVHSVKVSGDLLELVLSASDKKGEIPIDNPCQFRDPNPVAQGGEVARARQMVIDIVNHFAGQR